MMDWYVLQAFSGYENKVKLTLEDRIKRSGLQDSGRPEAAPTLGDKMLEHATHLIAFPGPKSKWTTIMINRAREKGIPAVSVPTPPEGDADQ